MPVLILSQIAIHFKLIVVSFLRRVAVANLWPRSVGVTGRGELPRALGEDSCMGNGTVSDKCIFRCQIVFFGGGGAPDRMCLDMALLGTHFMVSPVNAGGVALLHFLIIRRRLARDMTKFCRHYCHRSLQNEPGKVESKPATLRCFIHFRFLDPAKDFSIS